MRGLADDDSDQFCIVMECESPCVLTLLSALLTSFWDLFISDDNPEAFYTHWMNSALQVRLLWIKARSVASEADPTRVLVLARQDLVNSNVFKSNRPKMSFFRELDS